MDVLEEKIAKRILEKNIINQIYKSLLVKLFSWKLKELLKMCQNNFISKDDAYKQLELFMDELDYEYKYCGHTFKAFSNEIKSNMLASAKIKIDSIQVVKENII